MNIITATVMAAAPDTGFDAFLAANPDLAQKDVLTRWYSSERLGSEIARRQFVLPDRPTA